MKNARQSVLPGRVNKAKPMLLALAAALVITALIALGPLHRLDKLAQDRLFRRPG